MKLCSRFNKKFEFIKMPLPKNTFTLLTSQKKEGYKYPKNIPKNTPKIFSS